MWHNHIQIFASGDVGYATLSDCRVKASESFQYFSHTNIWNRPEISVKQSPFSLTTGKFLAKTCNKINRRTVASSLKDTTHS